MDLRITYGSDNRQRFTGENQEKTGGVFTRPLKEIQQKKANVPLPNLLAGRNHTFV